VFSSQSALFGWIIGSLMVVAAIRKVYLWRKRRRLFLKRPR
jgi:hypothetical protein